MTTYDLAAALSALPLAQRRFEKTLDTLTDDEARAPSALPGWSRGHVITHVARHAESGIRLATGALHGVHAEQYPGGAPARNADIEAGADRPSAELAADLARTGAELDAVLASMTEQAWARTVRFRQGEFPAARVVWSRWREVEIHHVDLGLARYTTADWPEEFVAAHLPHELAKLDSRLPAGTGLEIRGVRYGDGEPVTVDGADHELLAWLVGRPGLAAPELPNWG